VGLIRQYFAKVSGFANNSDVNMAGIMHKLNHQRRRTWVTKHLKRVFFAETLQEAS
jgi:IS30 family transposase